MRWLRFASSLAGGLVVVGSVVQAADVTYAARVDDRGKAWVDVDNGQKTAVRVRLVELTFEDGEGKRLGRKSLPCREDCVVGIGGKGSFGPIEGPRGWESFNIEKLLFVDDTAPEPPASRPMTPPPQAGKTTMATVPASESLTCNEYCRMLASIPDCAQRGDIPACVDSCRAAESLAACRPVIGRFFGCVAKEPPHCVDGRLAFGTCTSSRKEYGDCVRE